MRGLWLIVLQSPFAPRSEDRTVSCGQHLLAIHFPLFLDRRGEVGAEPDQQRGRTAWPQLKAAENILDVASPELHHSRAPEAQQDFLLRSYLRSAKIDRRRAG